MFRHLNLLFFNDTYSTIVRSFFFRNQFTVRVKKTIHLTFDHNFSKCRPIYKTLLLSDSNEHAKLYNN